MYEPHLSGFDHDRSEGEGPPGFANGSSLLDEIDRVAPIQRFDAFPKVCRPTIELDRPTYRHIVPSADPLRWYVRGLTHTGSVDIHKPITAWGCAYGFGLNGHLHAGSCESVLSNNV